MKIAGMAYTGLRALALDSYSFSRDLLPGTRLSPVRGRRSGSQVALSGSLAPFFTLTLVDSVYYLTAGNLGAAPPAGVLSIVETKPGTFGSPRTTNWTVSFFTPQTNEAPTIVSVGVLSGTRGGLLTHSEPEVEGTPVPTVARQYQRFDGDTWVSIPGATTPTYDDKETDEFPVRVRVTATNSAGQAIGFSNTLAGQASALPSNIILPTVTGPLENNQIVIRIGSTILWNGGSWLNADESPYEGVLWLQATADSEGNTVLVPWTSFADVLLEEGEVGQSFYVWAAPDNGSGAPLLSAAVLNPTNYGPISAPVADAAELVGALYYSSNSSSAANTLTVNWPAGIPENAESVHLVAVIAVSNGTNNTDTASISSVMLQTKDQSESVSLTKLADATVNSSSRRQTTELWHASGAIPLGNDLRLVIVRGASSATNNVRASLAAFANVGDAAPVAQITNFSNSAAVYSTTRSTPANRLLVAFGMGRATSSATSVTLTPDWTTISGPDLAQFSNITSWQARPDGGTAQLDLTFSANHTFAQIGTVSLQGNAA